MWIGMEFLNLTVSTFLSTWKVFCKVFLSMLYLLEFFNAKKTYQRKGRDVTAVCPSLLLLNHIKEALGEGDFSKDLNHRAKENLLLTLGGIPKTLVWFTKSLTKNKKEFKEVPSFLIAEK